MRGPGWLGAVRWAHVGGELRALPIADAAVAAQWPLPSTSSKRKETFEGLAVILTLCALARASWIAERSSTSCSTSSGCALVERAGRRAARWSSSAGASCRHRQLDRVRVVHSSAPAADDGAQPTRRKCRRPRERGAVVATTPRLPHPTRGRSRAGKCSRALPLRRHER